MGDKSLKYPALLGEYRVKKPDIKIEDVFESIGGYGLYQLIFTFAVLFPQIVVGIITLSPVFTGTSSVPLYCSKDFESVNVCGKNCTEAENGTVITSIVQEWNLVCSQSWIKDAITSCQMIGTMTGALLSSVLADRYGRKAGFYFVTVGTGLCGLLPAAAFSPITYAAARFLAGLAMGGCFVVLLVHLMEFLTPSWRTLCGSVSFFPIGEMLLGLLTYLVPDWRQSTVAAAAPIFLVFLLFPFIQESPRWLLTQNRTEEAYEVLSKIAHWNSKPPPGRETVSALQAVVLQEESKSVLKGVDGLKQIIRNPRLCKDLIILAWSNMANLIIFYGVAFNVESLSGDPQLNMAYMGLLDLFGYPAILPFNNRIGRKKTFILFSFLASSCLASILGLHVFGQGLLASHPFTTTGLALAGKFCIVAAYGALTCIIMETFPTTLRSTCMGLVACAGYIGGVIAPQTVFLGNIATSIPYIMYCFMAMTSAIASLFLFEMAGKPLSDTAQI